MAKRRQFRSYSASAQNDSVVIPRYHGMQALIRTLNATGGNASDYVKFLPCGEQGATTINTVQLAAATSIILDGDASVKNTLNGVAVAANDFVVVNTSEGWQAALIAGVNGSGADATVAINSITEWDGLSSITGTQTVGDTAYIVWAEDEAQILTGTGTLNLEDVFVGEAGRPCVIYSLGAASAAHYMSGVVEYVAP